MTMSSRVRELFDSVTARLAATGSQPLAEPPIAEMPIEDQAGTRTRHRVLLDDSRLRPSCAADAGAKRSASSAS